MEKKTIRIGVMSTRPCDIPQDSIYASVLVGASLAGATADVGCFDLRDDTGTNISDRNRKYCELTGLYWLWKNAPEDYIGLVHYRRFLGSRGFSFFKKPADKIIREEEMRNILQHCRIIVPRNRRYYIETLRSHYQHTHDPAHLEITRNVIREQCPEYLPDYDTVLERTYGHMFNISVMERGLTDQYCSWLFSILFEVEKLVDETGMTAFDLRYPGRISEIIFNVWLEHQIRNGNVTKDEICELPYIFTGKQNLIKKAGGFLAGKFLHRKYD